jgi:hypothetical protein
MPGPVRLIRALIQSRDSCGLENPSVGTKQAFEMLRHGKPQRHDWQSVQLQYVGSPC